MKLRTTLYLVPSLAISLAVAPAALTAAGLGSLPGAEPLSFAQQPPPAQTDAVTEVARQRYQEGVKEFDAGKFEDARAAFLQAYALKHAPAVLLNIGLSELKSPTNRAAEAGTHFQQFLREVGTATPDQKATAEKGIADAKKRAGLIAVSVDAAGADVSIDGTSVGKSPLADPVFILPGKHTVFAGYQGHSAAVVVDVKAGLAAPANLTTGAGGAPAGAVVPGGAVPGGAAAGGAVPPGGAVPGGPGPGGLTPAPPPVGTPAGGAPPGGVPSAYPPAGGSSGFSAPGTGPGPGAGGDQVSSDREPFFHWYKRKPIAWVGTGVTGVGLILGIAFSSAASGASKTANNHTNQIKKEDMAHPELNPDHRANLCGDKDTGAGALAHYADACTTLRSDVSRYHSDVAGAAVGWALFGVGAIGTVAYAMIDWFPKKGTPEGTASHAPKPEFAITPIVSPVQQGIGVVGSF